MINIKQTFVSSIQFTASSSTLYSVSLYMAQVVIRVGGQRSNSRVSHLSHPDSHTTNDDRKQLIPVQSGKKVRDPKINGNLNGTLLSCLLCTDSANC